MRRALVCNVTASILRCNWRLRRRCAAGLYFGAKQSSYFAVGKVTQEQVDDYAKRKGMDKSEAERWLQSMLNYEP